MLDIYNETMRKYATMVDKSVSITKRKLENESNYALETTNDSDSANKKQRSEELENDKQAKTIVSMHAKYEK
jgi:hypothetical protein